MNAHPLALFGSSGLHIDVVRFLVVSHQAAHDAQCQPAHAPHRHVVIHQLVSPETRNVQHRWRVLDMLLAHLLVLGRFGVLQYIEGFQFGLERFLVHAHQVRHQIFAKLFVQFAN